MLTEEQKKYVKNHSHLKCIKDMMKEIKVGYAPIYNFIYKNKLSLIPSPYHLSKKAYINRKQVEMASFSKLNQKQRDYIEAKAKDNTLRQISNNLGIHYRDVYNYCIDRGIEYKSGINTRKKEQVESEDGLWDVDSCPDWILGW